MPKFGVAEWKYLAKHSPALAEETSKTTSMRNSYYRKNGFENFQKNGERLNRKLLICSESRWGSSNAKFTMNLVDFQPLQHRKSSTFEPYPINEVRIVSCTPPLRRVVETTPKA